jgi:hypothetical protein
MGIQAAKKLVCGKPTVYSLRCSDPGDTSSGASLVASARFSAAWIAAKMPRGESAALSVVEWCGLRRVKDEALSGRRQEIPSMPSLQTHCNLMERMAKSPEEING